MTDSVSSTVTVTLQPNGQAEFDALLAQVGAAVQLAPPEAVQLRGAELCGWDQLGWPGPENQMIDAAGRACFVDAHRAGTAAVFIDETRDNEGLPVPIIFRTDGGRAMMYWDWTRSLSSEDWRSEPCDVLYVAEEAEPVPHLAFGCTPWEGASPA
ncbi:MAG: hypothetical protein WCC60_18920 [Ilumatobacteraceae bacterium]